MMPKETVAERWERVGREMLEEMKLRGDEFIKSRLRWEDWGTLLPRLVAFAKEEIRRRKWRGARAGVLPEGYDANSIAAEVITEALEGKARLAPGWTFQRLEAELQRMVSNEVRRLHKLKEVRAVISGLTVLPETEATPSQSFPTGSETNQGMLQEKQEAERQIGEKIGSKDAQAKELFCCICQGVVKRREIAAKLGIRVDEVTNCRKRLERRLEQIVNEESGIPRWVIEELRGKL